MKSLFNNLIVFEIANNHQGSVSHARKIIKELGLLTRKYNLNAAVKFQYRDLNTFIHKDFVNRNDVKHIPRFLSTKLSWEDFQSLIYYVKEEGMLTMVTPFDESSVSKCIEHGIDILKVASCSAKDWPLLSEITKAQKPTILSTGGCRIEDIDDLVSYFSHKNCDFSLMHCVGIYPTLNDQIQMNVLEKMIHRYPGISIGWSGHEEPYNFESVKIAVAKGAKILERHVGMEGDGITLNSYSMNPSQLEDWIKAIQLSKSICGIDDNKNILQEEIDSIQSLKRGVYTNKALKKGDVIKIEDVYFAMPCLDGQLSSGEFGSYRAEYIANHDYKKDEAITELAYKGDNVSIIRNLVHTIKGMLHEAKIIIPIDADLEISHHYGLDKVYRYGAVLFSIVNRSYCKKILICLPGQTNPMHMHKIKEETFQLLHGDLKIGLKDKELNLRTGEIFLIEPGVYHCFSSRNGAIFEEISSTHVRADSYYEDEKISILDPMQRKTIITDWQ